MTVAPGLDHGPELVPVNQLSNGRSCGRRAARSTCSSQDAQRRRRHPRRTSAAARADGAWVTREGLSGASCGDGAVSEAVYGDAGHAGEALRGRAQVRVGSAPRGSGAAVVVQAARLRTRMPHLYRARPQLEHHRARLQRSDRHTRRAHSVDVIRPRWATAVLVGIPTAAFSGELTRSPPLSGRCMPAARRSTTQLRVEPCGLSREVVAFGEAGR